MYKASDEPTVSDDEDDDSDYEKFINKRIIK
jgi:hypothetical protein